VKADWFADVSRNRTEREYIEFVSRIAPGSVPRLTTAGDGYFAMEYLGEEYVNWKEALMNGRFEVDWARQAGSLLGKIHSASRNDPRLAVRFDTMDAFGQLRIEPYLIATASRHPELALLLQAEARRLAAHRSALVHGDFSPKNILVSAGRMVLLDCEVACYGDPAFDVAFLFTHWFLKALYHKDHFKEVRAMIEAFREGYALLDAEMERRVTPLLVMLMLARVDGKSPVEYLVEAADKETVRTFCRSTLVEGDVNLMRAYEQWVAVVGGGKA
jgi:aminoglycoside phosphotransferase (APT) family kinase protein